MAPVSTLRPWKNGSNMDLNELQEGRRIFIPVFLKGGLVWTGDSHCRQGNGEVNLTALECAYREIVLQLIVRKDMKLEWPRAETKTHWIMHGLRRGPEQGDGERGPRDGGLPDRARRWCRWTATRPTRSPRWSPTAASPRWWTSARASTAWCPRPSFHQEVAGALRARLRSCCGSLLPRGAAAPVSVVTTSTDLKALVEAVGGERVQVESLAPPLHDPHAWRSSRASSSETQGCRSARADRPRPRALAWPRSARPWVIAALSAAARTISIPRRASSSSRPRRRESGRIRGRTSTASAIRTTGSIRRKRAYHRGHPGSLGRLVPGERRYFEANRKRFLDQLDERLKVWLRRMAPHKGTRVVAVHETWPYFAQRFGLVVVAVWSQPRACRLPHHTLLA